MQLAGIAIYSPKGQRRVLPFELNSLNVLTGKSATGKSAVLDIVEFCLGRSTIALPVGRITRSSAWFAALVQFGNSDRLMLARPNPEGKSTTAAMMMAGSEYLNFPEYSELHENADADAIRREVTTRLGIEEFRIDPGASLRYPYDVSVAQALLLCLQKQSEIANQGLLFHRQAESGIAQALKDTLPYFIGASGPRQVALARNLLDAQRALRRSERDLAMAQRDAESSDSALFSLANLAVAEGLMSASSLELPTSQLLAALTEAASAPTDTLAEGEPRSDDRQRLLDERTQLRQELQETESRLAALRQIDQEEARLANELTAQRGRLASLNLLPAVDGDSTACPLCSSRLESPDTTPDEIRSLLEGVERELARSQGVRPRHQRGLEGLQETTDRIRDRLRENTSALNLLAETDRQLAQAQERNVRAAYVKGRIAQGLEERPERGADPSVLQRDVERRRNRVAEIEGLVAGEDPEEELQSRLNQIARDMTDLAQRLLLEHSDENVWLDVKNLTVVADTPDGARPLTRIGSAENHVGYHLVAHLALHLWFLRHNRPVPRMLMLDQPTQAFFPQEIADASEFEDADWEAVRRQFLLLRDFVSSTGGGIQVIVSDHANLADSWFQEAVVENWREGRALIPADWD